MIINVSEELIYEEFVKRFRAGDCLLLHSKSKIAIFAKIINFFTGTKLDHVAQIIEVGDKYYVLAEFRAIGGKQITPLLKSKLSPDKRFIDNAHDIYFAKLNFELTDDQKSKLITFWTDLKDSYSLTSAIGSVNFFDSILSKLFPKLYIKKKNANFCSGAVNEALNTIGIKEKNYTDSVTPDEFARQSFIYEIIKLKTP